MLQNNYVESNLMGTKTYLILRDILVISWKKHENVTFFHRLKLKFAEEKKKK